MEIFASLLTGVGDGDGGGAYVKRMGASLKEKCLLPKGANFPLREAPNYVRFQILGRHSLAVFCASRLTISGISSDQNCFSLYILIVSSSH